MSEIEKEIKKLSDKVDKIDEKIVGYLNERANLTSEIRELKTKDGLPVYDPEREEEIFGKLTQFNSGPLSNSAIRKIYEKILDVMKNMI
ncbi:MAG: chorismate mutase [Candidatus Subteraquimicrobiales bacterium]|nr:chorismate mutase [Candidatus Subteraquimicrobiales bacterium]